MTPPAATSAFGLKEESPFRISVRPTAVESAASDFRAIWIQHLQKNIPAEWSEPTQPATTWLPNALEELKEIDGEVLNDGLPAIKAETKGEAARILRALDGQAIQPTTYPTDDAEDRTPPRKLHGRAVIAVRDAASGKRTVKATPQLGNIYHADIFLNMDGDELRDQQKAHATELAARSHWLDLP